VPFVFSYFIIHLKDASFQKAFVVKLDTSSAANTALLVLNSNWFTFSWIKSFTLKSVMSNINISQDACLSIAIVFTRDVSISSIICLITALVDLGTTNWSRCWTLSNDFSSSLWNCILDQIFGIKTRWVNKICAWVISPQTSVILSISVFSICAGILETGESILGIHVESKTASKSSGFFTCCYIINITSDFIRVSVVISW
jgi:hypothetical protein